MQQIIQGPATETSDRLRVGLIFRESSAWAAQATFLNMFAHSLAQVADEASIELGIVTPRDENGQHRVPPHLPGGRWFQLPAKGGRSSLQATIDHHKLDVVIDLFGVPNALPTAGVITWIADFQHVHLPQLFSAQEIKDRDESFQKKTTASHFILLSSHAAKADYDAALPHAADMGFVAPFPSSLVFGSLPEGDPSEIVRLYHLPEKFLLVANQYWSHKNHEVLLQALGQLAASGLRIPAAFTGLPADYRDPSNSPTSRMLQSIARLGLAGQVVPLGQIPFPHLQQLMRSAALVVQPSRFEGWSTVVQDIKALDRPLMCSDIPVHREQTPQALGHFACDDPSSLAAMLAAHWPALAAGPDPAQESRGLEKERLFAREHGLKIAALCRRAFEVASARRQA